MNYIYNNYMKKIISFCLWGTNKIFIQGAIENAKLAKIIYPDWIARFYVAEHINKTVIEQLLSFGAEVKICKWTKKTNGTFWRFLPLMETDVSHFISRDVDSRLSFREARAVNEWLLSDKVVHSIRDYKSHIDCIQAGLFGIKCNEFKRILNRNNASIYVEFEGTFFIRFADQMFLRNNIWKYVCDNNYIAHDRFHIYKTVNEVDFPLLEGEVPCGTIYDENNNITNWFKKAENEANINLIIFEHKNLLFVDELKMMQHFRILYKEWEILYISENIEKYQKVLLDYEDINYVNKELFNNSNEVFLQLYYLFDPRIKYFIINPEIIYEMNYDINKLIVSHHISIISGITKSFMIINPILIRNEMLSGVNLDVFKLKEQYNNTTKEVDEYMFFRQNVIDNHMNILMLDENVLNDYVDNRVTTLKDKRISVIIISRNDNYIPDYKERCKICFDSMTRTFDEVIYVDWNSLSGISLLDKLKQELSDEKYTMKDWNKIKQIVITPDMIQKMNLENAEECCQVLARNIGIRHATGEYIISSNIDIVVPRREEFDKIKIYDNGFYILNRIDIDRNVIFSVYNNEKYKIEIKDMYDPIDRLHQNITTHDNNTYECFIKYARIINCGDFQLGHRNIWYNIRGFEESMIRSFFSDGNIQLKVLLKGYKLITLNKPLIYHINHGARISHVMASKGVVNNFDKYLSKFKETENDENWGCYIENV